VFFFVPLFCSRSCKFCSKRLKFVPLDSYYCSFQRHDLLCGWIFFVWSLFNICLKDAKYLFLSFVVVICFAYKICSSCSLDLFPNTIFCSPLVILCSMDSKFVFHICSWVFVPHSNFFHRLDLFRYLNLYFLCSWYLFRGC
jgi:hypothetical protein